MTIEETLISWLNDIVDNKLWPLVMPEEFKTFPGVTYQRLKDFHPTDSGSPYGASGYLMRLVVWGDEYGPVRDLGISIRASLNKWRDTHLVTVDDSDERY